jgi:23S rRNA (cytosine1962-C5)-methyltransferase
LNEPTLILKPGREKSLLRRHPWVFAGATADVKGDPDSGDTLIVRSASGHFLARAAYSPHSQIVARVWTWDELTPVDESFFRRRIEGAIANRLSLAANTNALRWVNAESDGLPGIVVDRYGEFAVCQFLSAGAEKWKQAVAQTVAAQPGIVGVFERSDVDVREKEGLPPVTGTLAGNPPPDLIEIQEGACRFAVDIYRGHKTGFYLDQRDNRALAASFAEGREVLNCFAYTGGFGIWALRGGAAGVTNVDTSAPALELAQRNVELNGLDSSKVENVAGDVFHVLRQYRDRGRQFDLIILDPPKFAESRSQIEGATRGYKDINLLAFKLLRPGGVLFTFSCSGLIEPELFQKVVAGAALDSGREAQIVGRLTQAADHPVALNFPEGEYLKGLVCRVW